jgi:hypothetical protein
MPRAQVSPADQALLDELASREAPATRYQLERWRARGLLPRPIVIHDGVGTRTELTADSSDIAEVLAHVSGRGRPWQFTCVLLYQYGAVPSQKALRETARWLMEASDRAVARTTTHLRAEAAGDDLEAVERLITSLGRAKSGRPMRRNLLESIRSRHPHLSQRQLRERADAAELWTTYFLLHPRAYSAEDRDLLAVADGFADADEARSYGWSPRGRSTLQRTRAVASSVTRPEMLALARCYDLLEDEPGFEFLERGAFRFQHALADIATFRRQHSRNLSTPVSPRFIYETFNLGEESDGT